MRCYIALALLGLGTLTGCGGASGPVTLTVFAASSMTEAIGELGKVYEGVDRDVRVRPVFGGSQDMVERLRDREPADVLVTADQPTMDTAAKYVGERRVIAGNAMTIAVAPGNPLRIRSVASLSRPGLRVVLGAPMVPVGRYAREVLTKSGVTVQSASEEISARAVLSLVRTGEADAGIVYITDMRSAGVAASSVPIPADQNITAVYPAAPIKKSKHFDAAEAFIDWLSTATAKAVLAKHGFTTP